MSDLVRPGCHGGAMPDFDHYCEANQITPSEAPIALAAFISLKTGIDVVIEKVA